MKTYHIAIGVVKNNDKYLIGKRSKNKKFDPDEWEFVSGFIEKDEEPRETILRELKEETSLSGKIIKSAKLFELVEGEEKWIITPFLIQSDSNFKLNKEDYSQLKWVSREELRDYEDISEIVENLISLKII